MNGPFSYLAGNSLLPYGDPRAAGARGVSRAEVSRRPLLTTWWPRRGADVLSLPPPVWPNDADYNCALRSVEAQVLANR